MTTKTKKLTLLTAGIAGTLLASSVAAVTLSACTFQVVNPNLTAGSTGSTLEPNPQYNTQINWSDNTPADEWTLGDPLPVSRLVIDEQGLVYANNAKSELIGTVPNFSRPEIVIPASVQRITGYVNVVKSTTGTTTNTTKTNTPAFQNITSLRSVKFAGNNLRQIGASAFKGATNLETVQLPSSVKVIETSAFENTTNLTSINLDNVQVIGNNAFKGSFASANSLNSSINIKSAISIGNNAFENVANLQAINFSSSQNLIKIGDNAFKGATLGKTFDLSQAKNLTRIGNSVFENTTGVDTIKLPSNLISLGTASFKNSSIKSIDLSNTQITSVPTNAFHSCANLEAVTLGDKITTLGANSFSSTPKLSTVKLPDGLTQINTAFNDSVTVNSNLQSTNLSGITELDLSNTQVTTLPTNAFAGANKLTKLTLNNKITTISQSAFQQATALTTLGPTGTAEGTLKLPSSVTTISGTSAFQDTKFTSIDLSETKIATINQNNIFQNVPATSIKFPATLTTLGGTNNLPNTLTSVDLSTTKLTTIGNNAFENSKATDIKLPATLTSIGNSAFKGSTVTSLALPEGLTTIGNNAFENTQLTSITVQGSSAKSPARNNGLSATLPSSVTSVGSYTFKNTKLTGIDLSSTRITSLVREVFANNSELTTVLVPETLSSLDDSSNTGGQLFARSAKMRTFGTLADVTASDSSRATFKEQAILPKSINNMKNDAFFNSSFTSIDFSKIQSFVAIGTDLKKKEIPSYFLSGASNLETLVLPNWVAGNIRDNAFSNTPKLKSVTVGEFAPATYADGDTSNVGTFDISGSNISGFDGSNHFLASNLGIFKLPANFNRTSIPQGAFQSSKLTSVVATTNARATGENNIIDATTTTIGNNAFNGTALTSLDLSSATGLTSIGQGAFQNNKELASVDLSKNTALTSIGQGAFQGNSQLAEVKWPANIVTKAAPSLTTIGANAFSNTALTSLDLSNVTSLTSIGANAFSNNTSLETVKLPSSLQTSVAGAFQNIKEGATITYPNGVSMGTGTTTTANAFANDTTLTELDLSGSTNLTTLAAGTFNGATKLQTLTLPAKAVEWQLNTTNNGQNPFFNNSKELVIEYTAFTKSGDGVGAPTDFNGIDDNVKTQIANIMNKFSRYVSTDGVHPIQYSDWTARVGTAAWNSWIDQDLTSSNVFDGWLKDSTSSSLSEDKSGATKNQNGVTWKYEKDSTGNITITSQKDSTPINIYRASNKQTYFSAPVGNSNGAPAQDIKVTVKLTIVKATSSNR